MGDDDSIYMDRYNNITLNETLKEELKMKERLYYKSPNETDFVAKKAAKNAETPLEEELGVANAKADIKRQDEIAEKKAVKKEGAAAPKKEDAPIAEPAIAVGEEKAIGQSEK